jgi:hypothetical protein
MNLWRKNKVRCENFPDAQSVKVPALDVCIQKLSKVEKLGKKELEDKSEDISRLYTVLC